MKLTMIKKNPPLSSRSEFWQHYVVTLIKETDSINKVFREMYNHKHEAHEFIIAYGFNNTQIVSPEDLI